MAILSREVFKGSHWYKSDGTPFHSILTADEKKTRSTTLADARKIGLFPSVTSILGVFNKPQLEKWKMNQVAIAAFKTQPQKEESEEYYCKRIINTAFEQVGDAAQLGSNIHAALELGLAGEQFNPELATYVNPVIEWVRKINIRIIEREKVLVNLVHGFAGTTDVLFNFNANGVGIIDYKTRKTKPGEEVTAYDGQAMQLAAYAATYFGEDRIDEVLAANIFISSNEPGRMVVVKHTDMRKHWEAFKMATCLWRYMNSYDPRILK